MGTAENLKLEQTDVATAVSAQLEGPQSTLPVDLADDSWAAVSDRTGVPASVRYDATVFRVDEVTTEGTSGTVIASTDRRRRPGKDVFYPAAFPDFLGKAGDPTAEILKQDGVEILFTSLPGQPESVELFTASDTRPRPDAGTENIRLTLPVQRRTRAPRPSPRPASPQG